VVGVIHAERSAHLFDRGFTLRVARFRTRRIQGRKNDAREERDDSDDHQELDERKPTLYH